jgi:large subunit ribosomal protein L30
MSRELKVTQIKSAIGCEKSQKETVRSLGIKKLYQTVYHQDTPQIRGMIMKVRHLLKVEEVKR